MTAERGKRQQGLDKPSIDLLKASAAAIIGLLILLTTAYNAAAEKPTWQGVGIDLISKTVAYWRFNATSNVSNVWTDRAGDCNLTTRGGGTLNLVADAYGNANSGLYFNSSAYLNKSSTMPCSKIPLTRTTAGTTVFACGMINGSSEKGDAFISFGRGNLFTALISYTGSGVGRVTTNLNNIGGTNIWHKDDPASINDSYVKTHVCQAFTVTTTTSILYGNSTAVKSTSAVAPPAWVEGVVVGTRPDLVTHFMQGRIDFIGVFNTSLNATEMEYLIGNVTVGYGDPMANVSERPTTNNLSITGRDTAGNALASMNATVDGFFWQNLTGNFIQTNNRTTNSMNITVRSNYHFDAVYPTYNAAATNTTLQANLTPYANITVVDGWDNTSLIFNATFYNLTHSTAYLSQTQLRPDYQGMHSINITRGGYLPLLGFSVNLSGGTATKIELAEAMLYISAREWLSNVALLAFNVTVQNGSISKTNTTTTGNISFSVRGGTINVSIIAPGYYLNHSIVTTAALSGTQTTGDLTSSLLAVNASQMNVSIISAFTATATGITYPGVTITQNVTAGTAYFYLVNGSWNISFLAQDYNPNFTLFNITSLRHNHTFRVWKLNTVNITFRDEGNLSIITSNISANLIGAVASYLFNTSTGNIFREVLSPSDYIINYYDDAGIYVPREYQFELRNQTYNEFTLHLIKKTAAENVTLTLVDEDGDTVEGAQVNILRYIPSDNSYILVESPKTDFQGQVVIHVVKNTIYYRLQIYYGSAMVKYTDPAYIIASDLTIQVFLQEMPGQDLITLHEITSSLNYTDATSNFVFMWLDGLGTVTRGCLGVKRVIGGTETAWNISCADSASGTALVNAPPANGTTYHAQGYVVYGGDTTYLRTMTKSWVGSLELGRMGPWLAGVVIVLIALSGLFSAPLMVLLGGFAPFLASITGILRIPPAMTVPIIVAGIVLSFVLSRGEK